MNRKSNNTVVVLTAALSTALALALLGTPERTADADASAHAATSSPVGAARADDLLPALKPTESYLVYYGEWDDEKIKKAAGRFALIVAAARSLNAAQLKTFHERQAKVFGYISIGEDGLTSTQGGQPAAGDGSGPRHWNGSEAVSGDDKKKDKDKKKDEKKGVASYYVDEYECSDDGKKCKPGHDGRADRNGAADSGSLYVNAGDENWQKLVVAEAERLKAVGFDGIFLDTLDTAGHEELAWTRGGMRKLIVALHAVTKNILINRGLFFFADGPDAPQAVEIRQNIWGLMFEDFYTEIDHDKNIGIKSPYWVNNQTYVARLAGTQVLVLDYINSRQKNCQSLAAQQQAEADKAGWHNYVSWELTQTLRDSICDARKGR
jgi:hypothetical protein